MTLDADKLVAHRGYRALYPENSLLAHEKAIDAGALHLETDILFSAEGSPVLYHDSLMYRLSNRSSVIHLQTAAELHDTPLYEPGRFGNRFRDVKIAGLEQFVDLIRCNPQVQCYIELKRSGLSFLGRQRALDRVLPFLDPINKQATLISFDYLAIRMARAMSYPRLGVVLLDWKDRSSPIMQDIKPDCLFCNIRRIPDDASLARQGYPVIVYEIDDAPTAQHWLDRGASKIETFDVGGLLPAGSR